MNGFDTSSMSGADTLRLTYPQWQGAGRDMVHHLLPEFPLEQARLGYAAGSKMLNAILPEHHGPSETVDVPMGHALDSEVTGGIESREAITVSLKSALEKIDRHDPKRILTLGGECSVSVAPFSALAKRYGGDLAVIWIDSHPDVGTTQSEYHGYHAMAVSMLTGHGDPELEALLPSTIQESHLAFAGVHDWSDGDGQNAKDWGLPVFTPENLKDTTAPLLEWIAASKASKIAIHIDVDAIDSNDAILGLAAVPGGLNRKEIRRIVTDISQAYDLVGLTIAEFIPRDVLSVTGLIEDLPLTR
ncbi:MAG: arginase family protein [Bifidobacterium psychraerophilum]|uniref:arginase family protein n=1 Tax=Bifidobacterium psychraerophilum TaxID=218140 RepID=UPI0039E874B0